MAPERAGPLVVGLTGGLGSGKSTVAELLAARGARVVDADVLARQAVAPGGPAYQAVVDRFGPSVVAEDGTLDRRRLAGVVFADRSERAALEAIVHPAVRAGVAEEVAAAARAGAEVVVVDVPLLTESRPARRGLAAIIVVDCPEDVAVARKVAQGRMPEADARARITNQASRAERLAIADCVVDNGGDRDQLEAEVDRCWNWLESLAWRQGPL